MQFNSAHLHLAEKVLDFVGRYTNPRTHSMLTESPATGLALPANLALARSSCGQESLMHRPVFASHRVRGSRQSTLETQPGNKKELQSRGSQCGNEGSKEPVRKRIGRKGAKMYKRGLRGTLTSRQPLIVLVQSHPTVTC